MSDAQRRHGRFGGRARTLSVAVLALGLAAAVTTGVATRAQAAANRGPGFPAHYFAPYVDTSLNGAQATIQGAEGAGVRFFTLAFIISGGSGCQAMWNGVLPVDQGFLVSDVNAFIGVSGTGASDTQTFTPGSAGFTQLTLPFSTGAGVTSVTVFVHGWYAQGTVFADDMSVR